MEHTADTILAIINDLPQSEQERLKELLKEQDEQDVKMWQYLEDKKFAEGRICPHCGSRHVRRNGHQKNGSQKFICADCKRSFSITTNTLFSGSSKSLTVWRKYLECMKQDMSLDACAEACGIVHSTSFIWRHKILDLLGKHADEDTLGGIIEADEAFFPISYKGDQKYFDGSAAERKSRRRGGGSNKRGLSDELVCVPCAIDRKGNSISKIAKRGKVSSEALDKVFGNKIDAESTLCSDADKSYRKFAKSVDADLVQIKGGKSVKGIFHIQHINSFHKRLKDWMRHFNGVATKYLNNYLVWNSVSQRVKSSSQKFVDAIMEVIPLIPFALTCRNISERQPVPILV
ncbi:MAG: IS1595 family transposase [Bacteroidales bacterium]|nr:IS1595 family transposase [Bacteroidales bacterium]